MDRKTAVLFVCLSSLFCSTVTLAITAPTSPWQPPWLPQNRTDLRCDDYCGHCKQEINNCNYDECCLCRSSSTLDEEYKYNFLLEKTSPTGKSIAVPEQSFNSFLTYKIEFQNNDMTEIPSNICDWDVDPLVTEITENAGLNGLGAFWNNTVLIDLRYNKIRHIPDMNCLAQLDRLYLSHNQITHVSNTSFAELRYLRTVDLSFNRIQTVDPLVFTDSFMPFDFDMSNNQLQSLDVTNIIHDKPWCKLDYSGNSLSTLTNTLQITLDISKSYGPGISSLANNPFETFPDFKELLNLESLSDMGRLLSCGFDIRASSLACDCKIFEFVNLAKDVVEDLFRDYMNVTCASPEEVKGKFVMDVAHDKFRCSDIKYCPVGCNCYDQPSSNTLFVNCSGTGLEEMPVRMPESLSSKFINLDVSHNSISNFSSRSYLEDISFLNISNNRLIYIDDEVVNYIVNSSYIDISNNGHSLNLPRRMQVLNPCVLNMTNLKVLCNCDTLLIPVWLEKECTDKGFAETLNCMLPDGVILPARKFTKDTLNCLEPPDVYIVLKITLAGVASILIGVAVFAYTFRYEIYIVYLRLSRCLKGKSILPQLKFDVFMSIDEENESVREWTRVCLLPQLEDLGYRVYFPLRDLIYGTARESSVIDAMRECRTFLVVLSDSYFDQGEDSLTGNEWKYGWQMMKGNSFKKIILVNFDHVSSFDVHHNQIKAFLRVGHSLDFMNRKRDIIKQIEKQLGAPTNNSSKGSGLKNKKKAFAKSELFLATSSKRIGPDQNARTRFIWK